MIGTKYITEDAGGSLTTAIEERCVQRRSWRGTVIGAHTSDHADMSNEKPSENLGR